MCITFLGPLTYHHVYQARSVYSELALFFINLYILDPYISQFVYFRPPYFINCIFQTPVFPSYILDPVFQDFQKLYILDPVFQDFSNIVFFIPLFSRKFGKCVFQTLIFIIIHFENVYFRPRFKTHCILQTPYFGTLSEHPYEFSL